MKNYRLYQAIDFTQDDDFIRWVRFNSAEDNLFWDKWIDENPDKLLVIAEAKKMIEALSSGEKELVDASYVEIEIQKTLEAISKPAEIITIKKRKYLNMVLVAASLVLLIGIAFVLYQNQKHSLEEIYTYDNQVQSKPLLEQKNTSQKPVDILLPDSSVVTLFPDSRISYSNGFADSSMRDVYLNGEAFFSVKKNPQKPFRVFANEIVTRVLGTSFTVRCVENEKNIKVIVKTGKVSIYSQSDEKKIYNTPNKNKLSGLLISANQQVTYSKLEKLFEKELQERPQILNPQILDKDMKFEDKKIVEILELLQKAYGINISYDPDVLSSCTVTADLTDESLYRKLDLICKAVNAKYEIVNSEILIESAGCK